MEIKLPYGKGHIETRIDEKRIKAVLESKAHSFSAENSQDSIVLSALENPIQSEKLCNLSEGKKKVLLITSDHTRPVPSKITLPILLKEIRKNNPEVHIRILIATGCHRATSKDEMIEKFGEDLVKNEQFINHDSTKEDMMVTKGTLPSGSVLKVNSLVDWADLIVSEGFIEPHFFAGFSGGRKSILPGIAFKRTVMENHCSRFIADSRAVTGNLEGNPIHEDMVYAARAAKLAFILNVVIDSEKRVIRAFAGDPCKAHEEGCKFVREMAGVKKEEADIVITSNGGYPLDQNIYQSVKGMTAAETCVKKGGIIIIAASCMDGHGGDEFFKWFATASSPEEVFNKILSIDQRDTIPDQWQAQILARVLLKAHVIMVTDSIHKQTIEKMHMKHASNLEEALDYADVLLGYKGTITVIPDGVGVIVGI